MVLTSPHYPLRSHSAGQRSLPSAPQLNLRVRANTHSSSCRLKGRQSIVPNGNHHCRSCARWSAKWSAAPQTMFAIVSDAATERQDSQTPVAELPSNGVFKSWKGLWRIRHFQPSDILHVAELQASAFHDSLPVGVLDKLAYTMFKAEVLDGLKKKVPVLAEDSFAMLVVEECQINSSSSSSNSVFASAAAMPQSSRFAGGGSGNDSRDSIVCDRSTICDWNSADRLEDPVVMQPDGSTAAGINSTTCSYSTGRLVGVVEVALQDEAEVLQHLPLGVSNYAYISSMAVAADARRAGIGCTLLQAAEQQAALWQQALVSLHVYDTNVAALKLYEKHGMKVLATDSKLRRVLGGKVRHLMVKDVAACSGVSLEATPRAAAADG